MAKRKEISEVDSLLDTQLFSHDPVLAARCIAVQTECALVKESPVRC